VLINQSDGCRLDSKKGCKGNSPMFNEVHGVRPVCTYASETTFSKLGGQDLPIKSVTSSQTSINSEYKWWSQQTNSERPSLQPAACHPSPMAGHSPKEIPPSLCSILVAGDLLRCPKRHRCMCMLPAGQSYFT
jgi:hypothetical protein